MDRYFREALEGVKQAAEGIIKTTNALLVAKDEHEELRETIGRLESEVMQQGRDVRALREEVRALREDRNGGPV